MYDQLLWETTDRNVTVQGWGWGVGVLSSVGCLRCSHLRTRSTPGVFRSSRQ